MSRLLGGCCYVTKENAIQVQLQSCVLHNTISCVFSKGASLMLKNHKKQEGESEQARQLHYQVYNQWFSYTHLQLNTREKKKKFSFHLAERRKFFHCENMATSCLCLHPQKCTVCGQLCSRHACKHTHLGVCFGFCVVCGWLDGGFLPICRLAVKETASRRRKTGRL